MKPEPEDYRKPRNVDEAIEVLERLHAERSDDDEPLWLEFWIDSRYYDNLVHIEHAKLVMENLPPEGLGSTEAAALAKAAVAMARLLEELHAGHARIEAGVRAEAIVMAAKAGGNLTRTWEPGQKVHHA